MTGFEPFKKPTTHTNKKPFSDTLVYRVHRCSMADPRDYLSLTSPHAITDNDSEHFPTVAQYVAVRLIGKSEALENPSATNTPWNAIGTIYRYIFSHGFDTTTSDSERIKENIRRVKASVGRGLLYKMHQHPRIGCILKQTHTAKIYAINDHHTICSSYSMARIQNRLWSCGTREEPGENLYGEILETIRGILDLSQLCSSKEKDFSTKDDPKNTKKSSSSQREKKSTLIYVTCSRH